jgi:tetratricopeptide (TPR) repeat protein
MNANALIKPAGCMFLAFMLLSGCATQSLNLTVTRPAEVNLKGFEKIAIGDIADQQGEVSTHSMDISDRITSVLFESQRFEVMDRQHIGTLLKEHNLTASGLVNEKTAAEIGEFIGAAVFVFGRIQTDKYDEEVGKDDAWTDRNGNYRQTFWRRGLYQLTVHVSLVDLKTSKILAIKDLSAAFKSSTSADKQTPEKINVDDLYTKCVEQIANDFMKTIAPYQVTVVAKFITDSKVPELAQAIAHFKADDFETGISLLESTTEKDGLETTQKAKAYYNLGLAQMYSGLNDEAVENLQKAISLEPKSMYTNALAQAKREKENADKLKQQQQ